MNHPEYIRLKGLVNEHLLDFLPEIDNKSITLYDSMKYSLTAGGKRLRPVLLLAACNFCGGDERRALPYACAVEYIHTYSLIHDDLPAMDNDDLRRGKPTNHKVYGEAIALLAGDGLLSSAFEAMTKDMFLCFDDPAQLKQSTRAIHEIAKGSGCRGMVAGQCADLETENRQCSREMLDYIHINKTGSLIISSVRAGAYLGSADINTLEELSNYAEYLGLAFQIADDLLDVYGQEDVMGKRAGVDLERHKNTYPALYGAEASQARLRELTAAAVRVMEPYEERGSFFAALAASLAERTE
ncbi:MAG: polyprenyl synthetase family protein [Bacillota bacterium]|nr:polyprenyl synthetase family protein [Bacillota bacterium]